MTSTVPSTDTKSISVGACVGENVGAQVYVSERAVTSQHGVPTALPSCHTKFSLDAHVAELNWVGRSPHSVLWLSHK